MRRWYAYNGAPGGENIIGNYSLSPLVPYVCPNGSILCVIYAPFGGPYPSVISPNMGAYIIFAKASQSFYPSRYGTVPFVYTLHV